MQQEGRPGATSLAASILNCHDGIPPPEKRREVRYGSNPEVDLANADFRFALESGHAPTRWRVRLLPRRHSPRPDCIEMTKRVLCIPCTEAALLDSCLRQPVGWVEPLRNPSPCGTSYRRSPKSPRRVLPCEGNALPGYGIRAMRLGSELLKQFNPILPVGQITNSCQVPFVKIF
jgi:hypothetical protein